MENVTLNQQEQRRLQVLNSLLAEQVTLDQAAELMAVSSRHARRMLTARICVLYGDFSARSDGGFRCVSDPGRFLREMG